MDDMDTIALIDALRQNEGASVTICSENPDFNGQPNCRIEVNDAWTGWRDRSFGGNTVPDALRAALQRREEIAKNEGSEGPFAATEDVKSYLAGVVGAVEATREEQHQIWAHYHHRNGVAWKETGSGYLPTIGSLNGQPICISLSTADVHGHKILFYHATSRFVDHDIVGAWIRKHLPDANRTDATNFHNVFGGAGPRIERD